jgi:hypothetical protein
MPSTAIPKRGSAEKDRKDIPGCCGAKHVSHLRRLGFFLRCFPGLPAWASLCRASLRTCRRQVLRVKRRWFGVMETRRGMAWLRLDRGAGTPCRATTMASEKRRPRKGRKDIPGRCGAMLVSHLPSNLPPAGSQGKTALVWHGRSKKRRERSRRDFGAPQVRHIGVQPSANFGLNETPCFFKSARNSASKDIFL